MGLSGEAAIIAARSTVRTIPMSFHSTTISPLSGWEQCQQTEEVPIPRRQISSCLLQQNLPQPLLQPLLAFWKFLVGLDATQHRVVGFDPRRLQNRIILQRLRKDFPPDRVERLPIRTRVNH